ncbi:unnamed protein product, partial [Brenthis ino]
MARCGARMGIVAGGAVKAAWPLPMGGLRVEFEPLLANYRRPYPTLYYSSSLTLAPIPLGAAERTAV